MANIGIFGGTFNPPHNGHIHLAQCAVRELKLSRLYIIPTAVPPHKETDAEIPAEKRLEMCRLAFEKLKEASVSDLEIARGGKSYTVDTVRALRLKHPEDTLYLLMGSDMFLTIETWREYRELLRECVIVFLERYEGTQETGDFIKTVRQKYNANILSVKADILPVSSSEIRMMLYDEGLKLDVPPAVSEFIRENGLYQDDRIMTLSSLLRKTQSGARLQHSLSVANEAVKLAFRHGYDLHIAREAGILHDITKEFNTTEQLKLCKAFGIILDTVETVNGKLLHARTGPFFAKMIIGGLREDIFSAIQYHTTGRENMSPLEKIIYLADYIEPFRDFDGVDEVRKIAYRSLDEAMLTALSQTVDSLIRRNLPIHSNTLKARDFLLGRTVNA